MPLIEKLQREIKRKDRYVRDTMHSYGRVNSAPYDFEADDLRDLLEQAVRELARLYTLTDLQRSVLITKQGRS